MLNIIELPLLLIPQIMIYIWNSPQYKTRRFFSTFLRDIEWIIFSFIIFNFLASIIFNQLSIYNQNFLTLMYNIFSDILVNFLFLNVIIFIFYIFLLLIKFNLSEEVEDLLIAFYYLFIIGSNGLSIIRNLESNIKLNNQLVIFSSAVLLFFILLYYYQFFYSKSKLKEIIGFNKIQYQGTSFSKSNLSITTILIIFGIELLLIQTSFSYEKSNAILSNNNNIIMSLVYFAIIIIIFFIILSLILDIFGKYNFINSVDLEKKIKIKYYSKFPLKEKGQLILGNIDINNSKLEISTNHLFMDKEKDYYSTNLITESGLDLVIKYDSDIKLSLDSSNIKILTPKKRKFRNKFVFFNINNILIDVDENSKLFLVLI